MICKNCIHDEICSSFELPLKSNKCKNFKNSENFKPIKKGYWKKSKEEKLYYGWGMNGYFEHSIICSNCKTDLTEYGYEESEYCPFCGSKNQN